MLLTNWPSNYIYVTPFSPSAIKYTRVTHIKQNRILGSQLLLVSGLDFLSTTSSRMFSNRIIYGEYSIFSTKCNGL